MKQKQEYSTFGRQIVYTVAANIIGLMVGLIRTPLLTKGLGASGYGTFSLIHVTVSLIVPFAMLGFRSGIVRFLAAEENKERIKEDFFSAFTIVILSATFFSLFVFFLADILAVQILHDDTAAQYIQFGAVLIFVDSLLNLCIAFFRMRRQIGLFTIFNTGRQVLELCFFAVVFSLGFQLAGVISVKISVACLIVLFSLYIIIRQTGLTVPKFSNTKSYLKWGIPLTPNAAIMWAINVSDRYMIGYFLGSAATGIYSASYNIALFSTFVMAPFGVVLYPYVARAYDEGNVEKTRKYLQYSMKYVLMISIPAAVSISMLAQPLVQILTTNEFLEGTAIIPWVAAGSLINTYFEMCNYIIHLVKKTRISLRILGISAVLNISLNLILIPCMGILGAAVATLAAYSFLGLITLYVTRQYMKFNLSLPFIGKSIVASAIMAVIVWLIDPESIFMVIVSVIAGVVMYFGILLLLRGLNRQEINFFFHFAKDNGEKLVRMFRRQV
ncbi:MAG: flippase [Dehalococcoidales bacterium]|nr:flippase [Dehalococcoidales bacterium]